MTSRFFAIWAWLTASHAALFGLFWLLLQVPESNAAMLAASALLVLAITALACWAESAALLAWRGDAPARRLPRLALNGMPAVLAGFALFCLIAWATGHLSTAWMSRRGEIDAWLMLHFGWTRTARLHGTFEWMVAFIRYVIGISLALSVASTLVAAGWRALARPSWLAVAFGYRRLLFITAALMVFLWLPWRVVGWRPSWLHANWQELSFVSLKLGILYVLANAGWTLIVRIGRPAAPPQSASV